MACDTIYITRGDTLSYTLTAKDAEGTAVPLTGYSVEMECRDGDGDLVITFAPEITDASAGEVTLAMTPTETAALTRIGKFKTDALFTAPSGVKLRSKPIHVHISDGITDRVS